MPQISDELVRSIAILLSGAGKPIGTAFVVEHRIVDEDFFYAFYLITCEHCVNNPVRARFSNGLSIEISPNDWRKPTTRDDVVAFEVTDLVAPTRGAIGSINTGSVVRPREPNFGIGTDVYMLGLLVDVQDEGQNFPIARFGNLSAFAEDQVLFEQGNGVKRPCHLGDMRSRTGFSGSPVIGYVEFTGLDALSNLQSRLFGVHSAQHSERIRVASEDGYKALDIPSSMTRIVPAWEVLSLIETDHVFIENQARRKREGKGLLGNTGGT